MPEFSRLEDVPRGPHVPRWDPSNRMVCGVVYLNRVKCYVYLIETKGLQCHRAIRVLHRVYGYTIQHLTELNGYMLSKSWAFVLRIRFCLKFWMLDATTRSWVSYLYDC